MWPAAERCSGVRRVVHKIGTFLRWVLSAESLPSPSEPPRLKRGAFARWLLSPESLPAPAETTPAGHHGFVRWLLSTEVLPTQPVRQEPGQPQSFWTWVASAEHLPEPDQETRGDAPEEGFFRWLLRTEECAGVESPREAPDRGFFAWLFSGETLPS